MENGNDARALAVGIERGGQCLNNGNHFHENRQTANKLWLIKSRECALCLNGSRCHAHCTRHTVTIESRVGGVHSKMLFRRLSRHWNRWHGNATQTQAPRKTHQRISTMFDSSLHLGSCFVSFSSFSFRILICTSTLMLSLNNNINKIAKAERNLSATAPELWRYLTIRMHTINRRECNGKPTPQQPAIATFFNFIANIYFIVFNCCDTNAWDQPQQSRNSSCASEEKKDYQIKLNSNTLGSCAHSHMSRPNRNRNERFSVFVCRRRRWECYSIFPSPGAELCARLLALELLEDAFAWERDFTKIDDGGGKLIK